MVAFRLYAIHLNDVLNSAYDSVEADDRILRHDPTRCVRSFALDRLSYAAENFELRHNNDSHEE